MIWHRKIRGRAAPTTFYKDSWFCRVLLIKSSQWHYSAIVLFMSPFCGGPHFSKGVRDFEISDFCRDFMIYLWFLILLCFLFLTPCYILNWLKAFLTCRRQRVVINVHGYQLPPVFPRAQSWVLFFSYFTLTDLKFPPLFLTAKSNCLQMMSQYTRNILS